MDYQEWKGQMMDAIMQWYKLFLQYDLCGSYGSYNWHINLFKLFIVCYMRGNNLSVN